MTDAQREAVARVLYERGGLGGSWTRIMGRLRDLYLARADEVIAAYEAAGNTPTHRHRKGGLYQLLGYGPHTETGELFAIYRDAEGKLWSRPAAMFDDGRFTPIEPHP